MVLAVLGSTLFLPEMGVSAFAAPKEGQAYLAGIEELRELPNILANTMGSLTALLMVLLIFAGNVLLGVAVWRSGTLPRWAGAIWATAAVLMYPMGLVYEATIGPASTPHRGGRGGVDGRGRGLDGLERDATAFRPGGGRSSPTGRLVANAPGSPCAWGGTAIRPRRLAAPTH